MTKDKLLEVLNISSLDPEISQCFVEIKEDLLAYWKIKGKRAVVVDDCVSCHIRNCDKWGPAFKFPKDNQCLEEIGGCRLDVL